MHRCYKCKKPVDYDWKDFAIDEIIYGYTCNNCGHSDSYTEQ